MIEYIGRKTGKAFAVPVNFLEIDNKFFVTSTKSRVWWKNLKNNRPFTILMDRKKLGCTAEIFTEPTAVADGLELFLKKKPKLAKFFQVAADADGTLNQDDLMRAASERILLKINKV